LASRYHLVLNSGGNCLMLLYVTNILTATYFAVL
jgi:hypothetical protein